MAVSMFASTATTSPSRPRRLLRLQHFFNLNTLCTTAFLRYNQHMNKEQGKTAVQIGILFILPVLLLYFGFIPLQYRSVVLLAVTLIIISIIIAEKWSLQTEFYLVFFILSILISSRFSY